jgi:hypothetical protein
MTTEAEESPLLRSVIRKRLVKTLLRMVESCYLATTSED